MSAHKITGWNVALRIHSITHSMKNLSQILQKHHKPFATFLIQHLLDHRFMGKIKVFATEDFVI